MGLTAVDLEGLTLGDIEAIAKRTREAAETLTQALSLLRGAAPATVAATPVVVGTNQVTPSMLRLSPAEQAEKDRLLRMNRDELPDDIKAMESAS